MMSSTAVTRLFFMVAISSAASPQEWRFYGGDAGGVVLIGATIDSRFRGFDAPTGEQLWAADLEAMAHATPITYMGKKTGKQFVVIVVGGRGFFKGKVSDVLAAFALPD